MRCFHGLPRGCMECSSPRRFAVRFDSTPNGRSRFTLSRNASSSATVGGSLTQRCQFFPRGQWHHIVEQSKIGQFAAEQIHNRANVISVPKSVNLRLNGYYSSRPFFTGISTVREWLKGQSYEVQRKFGLYHTERILKEECRGH